MTKTGNAHTKYDDTDEESLIAVFQTTVTRIEERG